MFVHANRKRFPCDVDPRQLTSVTHNGMPVRTLARRVDGAFPCVINPVAIWEVKSITIQQRLGVELLMVFMKHYWMGWNSRS